MSHGDSPSRVRYAVVLATTFTSFLLYLDRICLAEIVKAPSFLADLALNKDQIGDVLAAFFFAYALAQVPAGCLGDRFGARGMMTFYVALWSVATVVTGMAGGFVSLLVARLGCGIAQAGAYPVSGGLLSRWVPFPARALASSVVAFGGRVGGAVAPYLTVLLIAGMDGWRPPLIVYGVAGLGVAGLFWVVFRERPEQHPRCNAAECALIERSRPPGVTSPHGQRPPVPWLGTLTSRSLWCNCVVQWGTNIGWAFLVTWLPTYLKEAKGAGGVEGGRMASIALFTGMAGMLFGGWLCDAATRRMGIRWGRSVPLALTRFLAAAAYLACLWLESPWALVAAFAFVAFMTDMGLASSWAFTQDVSGRNVGAIFGWGNMWGNLGAALTAKLLPKVIGTEAHRDWDNAFLLCAASFVIAGVAALGIDATKPIGGKQE
jgi:ACS family glucarate transporter-like MFS transporter